MDMQLELTLARLRDLADLYRERARAQLHQADGVRREADLVALDAEYADDLAAAEKDQRARDGEARRLEDELKALEAKLQDRRRRQATDAATVLALADEIANLRQKRDELEQQLLTIWQRNDLSAADLLGERDSVAAQRETLAHRREELARRAAQADRALPEIEGELGHLIRQLPVRVASRLTRLAQRLDDPIADLVGGACGTCGQSLPPQSAVDADRGSALVTCQGCGRFVVARSSRRTRG
jgi:predicted  nucleic acid-binding Zn-ribbon protein